ncbi:MAG: DUF1501 domain-containing protein [Acidimicrobiales bacterium]
MSSSTLSRRRFLGTTVGAGLVGVSAGTTTRLAFGDPNDPATGDILVSVFLRGGADGLSLIPAYGDPDYARVRPTIAVPRPGQANGALDLNGYFGMHPAMRNLYQTAWGNGHLAVVHAVGLPDAESDTRSHFEAQDYWERSSVDISLRTGWIGRYLGAAGATSVVSGVGIRSALPVALHGFSGTLAVYSLNGFRLDGFPSADMASVGAQLNAMYASVPGPLGSAARSALTATELISTAGGIGTQNGAVYPNTGAGRDLRAVAQLIRANIGLRAACVDVGGWDMHENMGTPASGQMADRARQLADALAAFYTDLGTGMNEVTVVTMSEFGRTVEENGSGGLDHGRGSCMMVMGGSIRGGVYTNWPTLRAGLDRNDDLLVTTDFRTVLAEIVQKRLDPAALGSVFPGFGVPTLLNLAQ